MSLKLVIFAVAVFAAQANGQILRPFIAGYANGLAEFAKPFVQIGRNVMSPAADYFSSLRPQRPQIAQWMIYPNQRPQAQPAFEGYETLGSTYPNRPSIVQIMRPRPFNPQIYPLPSQEQLVIPPRPQPIPVPAPAPAPGPSSSSSSSSSEESQESEETFVPTNLLPEESIVPLPPKIPEAPKVPEVPEVPEVPVPSTLDIKNVPQTLPLEADEQ